MMVLENDVQITIVPNELETQTKHEWPTQFCALCQVDSSSYVTLRDNTARAKLDSLKARVESLEAVVLLMKRACK